MKYDRRWSDLLKKSQKEYASKEDGLIKDYFEGIQKGMEIGHTNGFNEALDVLTETAWEMDQRQPKDFDSIPEILEHYKRMVQWHYDVNYRNK